MDIVLNDDSKSWLITGFFTPNYRELTESFATSLRAQGHPHHLFAVERSGTWNYETMRKPSIALAALDTYPKKTVILMDVDCTVNGALDELVNFNPAVDVACFMYVKTKKIGRHRQRTSLSSRVVLLRPTAGARILLENWRDACVERPWMHGDEPNMMLALARSSGTAFSPIPLGFSGREIDTAPPGSIITHDSASHKDQNPRSFLKQLWHTVGASSPVDVAPKAERREREHS